MTFSLKWLLIFVAWLAIALASVKSPSLVWASVLGLVALATLFTAVIAAIFSRGSIRAFAVGYAIVAGGLLFITTSKGFGSSRTEPSINAAVDFAVSFLNLPQTPIHDYMADFLRENGLPMDAPIEFKATTPYGRVEGVFIHFEGTIKRTYPFSVPQEVEMGTTGRPTTRDKIKLTVLQHLILLSSLTGGLAGLYFYRLEQRRSSVELS